MSTQEKQGNEQEITITPEAAEQIRLIRQENKIPDTHGLRIGIRSGGCCGITYLLAFDEKIEAKDKVIKSEGISLYVDEESLEILTGTILEYVDGPHGRGFRFDNPNDMKSCNCEDGSCG